MAKARSDLRRRAVVVALSCVMAAGMIGCASKPYAVGRAEQYHVAPELQQATETQIERGQPRPVIDTVGWVVGIPGKIFLWDRRIANHNISPETEEAIAEYLAANELTSVKVRINEYDPAGEWDRLVANKSVAWGWRYTFGTVSWLGYTLLPGRIFGDDSYNPYTNTINLYSDVASVALHEGGHSRYWAEREYKGNHAAVYSIVPGAPLYYEAVATNDALGYLQEYGTAEGEREAYEILYPAYGTYIGGTIGCGGVGDLACIAGGHVVGRIRSHRVADRPARCEQDGEPCVSPTISPLGVAPVQTAEPAPLPTGSVVR